MRRLVSLMAFLTFLPGCVETLTLSCVQTNPRIHESLKSICRNKGGLIGPKRKTERENGEALYSVICRNNESVEIRVIDLDTGDCSFRQYGN
jgi:hypothetical protein